MLCYNLAISVWTRGRQKDTKGWRSKPKPQTTSVNVLLRLLAFSQNKIKCFTNKVSYMLHLLRTFQVFNADSIKHILQRCDIIWIKSSWHIFRAFYHQIVKHQIRSLFNKCKSCTRGLKTTQYLFQPWISLFHFHDLMSFRIK